MKFRWITLAALSWITWISSGFAYESDLESFGYQDLPSLQKSTSFDAAPADATRIQKFEAALDALGIPVETTPDFSDFVHANEANENDVRKNLTWLDPDQGLARYLSFSSGNLQLFRDFFKAMISLDYLEFQQTLSSSNPSNDSSSLIQRLKVIAAQTQANEVQPLRGLRIVIDPGHMGGDDWDRITGKFVSVGGRKVSEGSLTLWTSFLVAGQLEKLGATVLLTREKLAPVLGESIESYDPTPYRNQYFQTSMDDWMAPYLQKSIAEVRSSIVKAPEVKTAFSPSRRPHFFVTYADLEARSKIIDQFQPDITLDIHFDANDTAKLQNKVQSLEAFVPGGFRKNETGGRRSKALALKHLLEVRRWNQSIDLADQVTQSMSTALQIPRLSVPEAFTSIRVRDGVYARNLYIARRALSGLIVYLECLHYDHVNEHQQLSLSDRSGSYRAITFRYPHRLDPISEGIKEGLVSYFRNFQE